MNQNENQSTISVAQVPSLSAEMKLPGEIFNVANSLTLVAWIFLLLASRMRKKELVWIPLAWVGILCLSYTVFIARLLSIDNLRDMGSLAGVMRLFDDPKAALVGWIHYFALDLTLGIAITLDAIKRDVAKPLVSAALLLSFFAGPVGLVFYAIVGVGPKGFKKLMKATT